jgi:tol-pal system protein YbgF
LPPVPGAPGVPPTAASNLPPGAAPSADLLYSNGLRDLNGKKYELATQEFSDYLRYYPTTDLASNAQFYLGYLLYVQQKYDQAVDALDKLINNYPKSFKIANAHLFKGYALIALGEKSAGVSELRMVVKNYPGTDEGRQAKAKLQELGLAS